jgi:hypothetical protein
MQLTEVSAAMLHAAEGSDWERVAALDGERMPLVRALMAGLDPGTGAEDPASEEVRVALQAALDYTRETLNLLTAARSETQQSLLTLSRGVNASRQYEQDWPK